MDSLLRLADYLCPCTQNALQLNNYQGMLAKDIWRRCRVDLANAKEDRDRIIYELQASGAAACMQHGMLPDRVFETNAILQQAAALAENSAIQHEIMLHSQRRFTLQACSIRSLLHAWFSDLSSLC